MTEEEFIKNQFTNILNNLVNNKIAPTGTAILSAQQPMILLFEKLIYKINRQDTEINKLNNVIDRMAEVIEECRQNDCIETTDDLDMSEIAGVEKIKEYFMKENTNE